MVTLVKIAQVFLYILAAVIMAISQVYADVCDEAYSEFVAETQSLTNKNMMTYDDVRNFSVSFEMFKSRLENQDCKQEAILRTASIRQTVKEKRLNTVKKFLGYGQREEAGKDIKAEYEYLSGENKKYKYEFEEAFSDSAPKSKPQPIAVVTTKPKASVASTQSKCGEDRINQNKAVNIYNVRNQGAIGWCYAYTAADLASFKLDKKISAVSLYNDSGNKDIESTIMKFDPKAGGDIKYSLDTYIQKNNGLCLEEDLPSSDFKFCTDNSYLNFLKRFLIVLKTSSLEQEINVNQCFRKDMEQAFPGISPLIIQNQYAHNKNKIIEYIYGLKCSYVTPVEKNEIRPVRNTVREKGFDWSLKKIDEQIQKGQIVGIEYAYDKLDPHNKDLAGDHASVVVGKRTNPESGACEYLVRNSWGADCQQKEGNGLTCHKSCDEAGNNCRYSGHFWASADRLKNALQGTVYLQ